MVHKHSEQKNDRQGNSDQPEQRTSSKSHRSLRRMITGQAMPSGSKSYRVAGGSHPPPAPTERGVRIYRTTLFGSWFTALQAPAASRKEDAV